MALIYHYNYISITSSPLSQTQMEHNVDGLIREMVTGRHWSEQALAGMLGNAQVESSINPGRYQNDVYNPQDGVGLLQWTPGVNYINWCQETQTTLWSTMDSAITRVQYEFDNGLQYYPTAAYPLTFAQYVQSTMQPSYLARAWSFNYERPAAYDEARALYATAWYIYITGHVPIPVPTSTPKLNIPLYVGADLI